MRLSILPVAVGVLVLASCAASTPAKPSPTVQEKSAHSVQQWASKVAEQKVLLDRWETQWAADSCSPDGLPAMPCGMELLGGSFVADAVDISLTTVSKQFGAPPSEIKDLVTETIAASSKADLEGKAWTASCNTAPAESCTSLTFQFTTAMQALSTKFTAWSPYLG